MEGKKLGLVGRCLLAGGLALGCASCATEEEAMVGSLFGTMGMMSPNAAPNEAMGFAGIRDVSQSSLNSMNAEKMGADVNVYIGGSSQKFYTTEIYNLDTNEKEIEIVGHWWIDYALDKMEDNKFPSNGYEMVQKINGRMVESSIINQKIEGERLCVMRGDKMLASRKRGAGHFPGIDN